MHDDALTLPDGRRLAFTRWGDPGGHAVLFFHGTGHSRLFCPDPAAVSRVGACLYALDRPGVGGSDAHEGHSLTDGARDALAFSDALGLGTFGVVGWSGGAWYAAALAALAPTRLSGVALVAGGAGPFDAAPLRDSLGPAQRATLELVVRLGPIGATRAALALPSVQADARPVPLADLVPPLPPGDVWLLADPERRPAFDAASREAARQGVVGLVADRVARFSPWGFRVEELGSRVCLFQGAEDAVYPVARGDDWAARIPGVRRVIWPDVGHLGVARHFAEVLDAALRSHP